jgi:PhoH-like ATPase
MDTSVLLHDHTAILQFDEHRLALPLTVLEELDTFKVGSDAKHFEARACHPVAGQTAGRQRFNGLE